MEDDSTALGAHYWDGTISRAGEAGTNEAVWFNAEAQRSQR
jgi:hypothetical protein